MGWASPVSLPEKRCFLMMTAIRRRQDPALAQPSTCSSLRRAWSCRIVDVRADCEWSRLGRLWAVGGPRSSGGVAVEMAKQATQKTLVADGADVGVVRQRRRAPGRRCQRAVAERLMKAPCTVEARVLGEDVIQLAKAEAQGVTQTFALDGAEGPAAPVPSAGGMDAAA